MIKSNSTCGIHECTECGKQLTVSTWRHAVVFACVLFIPIIAALIFSIFEEAKKDVALHNLVYEATKEAVQSTCNP